MKVDIETLRKTKGIGKKTLARIIEEHMKDNQIKSFVSSYNKEYGLDVSQQTNLINGDMIEELNKVPDKSVNLILTDLPYGTTACSWDQIIPFEILWSHYKRIITDDGVIALFGSEPFSSTLRVSNLDWYKYDWVWEKPNGTNFFLAKKQPLKVHETISIFSPTSGLYQPQLSEGKPYKWASQRSGGEAYGQDKDRVADTEINNSGTRYPRTVLRFKQERGFHPTQKPVELLEYLIKTYSKEGDLVLDSTMGSGSTGVAALKTNRRFIGIELDEEYFNIAEKRILE
mgnify:CR=1 FL=1